MNLSNFEVEIKLSERKEEKTTTTQNGAKKWDKWSDETINRGGSNKVHSQRTTGSMLFDLKLTPQQQPCARRAAAYDKQMKW